MSFIIGNNDCWMTGFIGWDRKLYWSMEDLYRNLGYRPGKFFDPLQVGHTMGEIPGVPRQLLRTTVVEHSHATYLMRWDKSNLSPWIFGSQLNHPSTSVRCIESNDVTDIRRPTRIKIVDFCDYSTQPFFVWLEFFTQSVMVSLYSHNIEPVDSLGYQPSSEPPPEPPSEPPSELSPEPTAPSEVSQHTVAVCNDLGTVHSFYDPPPPPPSPSLLPPVLDATLPPEKVLLCYNGCFFSYALEK